MDGLINSVTIGGKEHNPLDVITIAEAERRFKNYGESLVKGYYNGKEVILIESVCKH